MTKGAMTVEEAIREAHRTMPPDAAVCAVWTHAEQLVGHEISARLFADTWAKLADELYPKERQG